MKNRCVEKALNTVATKGSCCLNLISGFIDETEKYYTNNKCSLDPSEYKKQRCLDFQKFTRTVPSYNSQEANFRLFKGSTEISSKLESVGALKQNTESASEELSSTMQISKIEMFSGLFLKLPVFFHIKAHQNKEHT